MKALFLYNVRAGRGKAFAEIERAAEVFRAAGHDTLLQRITFGENPFAGGAEFDLVVVAGGDGTLNYVVNNMKTSGADLPIAIIPAGTANDFAHAVGMSSKPVEAARQILGGEEQRLDCGRVNGLYYVNVFSFGLFTTTSQHTPDARKRMLGKLAYILEGSKELRAWRSLPLHVETDEGSFDVDALIALVFNGETAGGFRLARTASIRDGMFDGLILERHNPLLTCGGMIRYLLRGKSVSVRCFKSRHIRITSSAKGIHTDVDGQKGADFPLDIECVAGGLRVICPRRKA